jgi:hypothetical protein
VPVAELGERRQIAAVRLHRVRRLVALLGQVGQKLGDFGTVGGHQGVPIHHEGTKDTKDTKEHGGKPTTSVLW